MATGAPPTAEPAKDTIDDMLLLSALREEGKCELLEILESIRGRKCLVTDVQLGGLLSQIVVEGSRFFSDNDVEHLRELKEEGLGDFFTSTSTEAPDHIVYIVRPHLPLMSLIANQIRNAIKTGIRSTFHVYFVPQQSTVCLHLLEEQLGNRSIFDRILFGEFELGLIPFDTDILSLEMDGCFKQCVVDGDLSSLNIIAQSLLKLQMLFGIIPNIRSKGHSSKRVLQKLLSLRVEELEHEQQMLQQQQSALSSTSNKAGSGGPAEEAKGDALGGAAVSKGRGSKLVADKYNQRSEIDLLVIMDRDVDLVSPLVTPLTYEGLIDETVGIENGRVRLDAAVLGSSDQQDALSAKMAATAVGGGKGGAEAAAAAAAAAAQASKALAAGDKVPVVLNNNDAIYAEIRDLSIERLGAYLQEKAIHIRERYTTFRDNKDASITEIHDFVKKIPKLTMEYKSLNQHINIAEMLKQRTDSRAFLDQWQEERGMLEGDSHLDEVEEILYADTARTQMFRVLRLLCLQSLTAGGIRATRYDGLRRAIVQTYGYQHAFTMSNLEKAGLIKRKDAIVVVELSSQWTNMRKQLRLIDERANGAAQDSISYVSAGYAPLLVRLVQLLGHNNVSWECISEVLKQLPGPVLEFTQQAACPEDLSEALERSTHEAAAFASSGNSSSVAASSGGGNNSAGGAFGSTSMTPNALLNYTTNIMSSATSSSNNYMNSKGAAGYEEGNSAVRFGETGAQDKKTMLLFVVGGLSYIEIAAFRFLSNDSSFPYRIMLATTKLVNGSTLISSLKHTF